MSLWVVVAEETVHKEEGRGGGSRYSSGSHRRHWASSRGVKQQGRSRQWTCRTRRHQGGVGDVAVS